MPQGFATSPSLLYRDSRLMNLRPRQFSPQRMVEALLCLYYQSDDVELVGKALCVLAAMQIPGDMVVRYQIVPKTFPFTDCAINGELARATRDRLMLRKEMYYAESKRQQLRNIPLSEVTNEENKQLDRKDARRSQQR
ncbi:hypothetical protein QR680_019296 [Steinernema hermaphroditum]|uniref:Uncharacterized protein n=1 Tax=Steinernema hermaphroditum TaxID=289476 RepID=A0AA39GQM6_9BILA|nr:hypothetical protein QR680_019296 [Steinernema hermaphroditum]